jgi:hypothetical protein
VRMCIHVYGMGVCAHVCVSVYMYAMLRDKEPM